MYLVEHVVIMKAKGLVTSTALAMVRLLFCYVQKPYLRFEVNWVFRV